MPQWGCIPDIHGLFPGIPAPSSSARFCSLNAVLLRTMIQAACAAAIALGRIASADANKALASAKPRPALAAVCADASLSCAEKLRATGHAKEAKATYERLLKSNPSELIRQAADRGLKACPAA